MATTCGCGFQAPADFAFCPRCGQRLAVTCGGCGTPSPSGFAFCPRCGTRLAGASPAPDAASPVAAPPDSPRMATRADDGEDRRPVTVVFADLAGFTAIGERLDP